MADDNENECFLAMLHGIAKQDYYGEETITDGIIKDQIYPQIPDDEFSRILLKARNMLKNIASADMDFDQLDAFLVSQAQKKERGITDSQAQLYMKFWKSHKQRIHDSLVSRTRWSNSLKGMNWRIDMKVQSRSGQEVNVPTAIIELQVANEHTSKENEEGVQFELDATQLSNILERLNDAHNSIRAFQSKQDQPA
ncbi:PREDICTED: COMM domain-containing protein 1-like isoform X2 [Priapulus caudatus]|nr:PREDICTED: COMM domain-containing protein 1-like isoform X2 [Priapulus caudatus]